jgi:hypothetical protein
MVTGILFIIWPDIQLFSVPVSDIRPDMRQVKSGIQPDTGYKGRISGVFLVVTVKTIKANYSSLSSSTVPVLLLPGSLPPK